MNYFIFLDHLIFPSTLFAYGNIFRYYPRLVDLRRNFFVLCTNMKYYLYNYSYWIELSMNIHEERVKSRDITLILDF